MRKLFIPILILVAFILIINSDVIYSQGVGTLGSNKSWVVSDTLFADFFMTDDSSFVYFISPMHFDSLSVSYITKDTTDTTVVLSVWEVGRIDASGEHVLFPQKNLIIRSNYTRLYALDSSRTRFSIGNDGSLSLDEWIVEVRDDFPSLSAIPFDATRYDRGQLIGNMVYTQDDTTGASLVGVKGYALIFGSESRAKEIIGLYGYAGATLGSVGKSYGVLGVATGGDTNIGIYGEGSDYAGYFAGNIFVSDTAIIDTINPSGDYVVILDTIIAVESILIGDDRVDLLDSVMYMISDTITASGGTDSSWHLLTADTLVITENIQIGDDKVDLIDSVRYIISDSITSQTVKDLISDSIQSADRDTVKTKYIKGLLSTGLGAGLKVEAETITFTSIDSPNIHIAIGEDATAGGGAIVEIAEDVDKDINTIKGINVTMENDGNTISTTLYGIYSAALHASGTTAKAIGVEGTVNKMAGSLPIGIGVVATSVNADSNIGIKATGNNYAVYAVNPIRTDTLWLGTTNITDLISDSTALTLLITAFDDSIDNYRSSFRDSANSMFDDSSSVIQGWISDTSDVLLSILDDTIAAHGQTYRDSANSVFDDSSSTIQSWVSDSIQSADRDTVKTKYIKGLLSTGLGAGLKVEAETITFTSIDSPNIHIAIGEDATAGGGAIVQIQEVVDKDINTMKAVNIDMSNDGNTISTTLYGIYSAALHTSGTTAKAIGVEGTVNKIAGSLPIGIGVVATSVNADSNIGIKATGNDYAGYFVGNVFIDDTVKIGDEKIDLFDSLRYIVSDSVQKALRDTVGFQKDGVPAYLYFHNFGAPLSGEDSSLVFNSGRGAIDIAGGIKNEFIYFHESAVYDTLGLVPEEREIFRNKVTITAGRIGLGGSNSYNHIKFETDSTNSQFYCAIIEWVTPDDFYSFDTNPFDVTMRQDTSIGGDSSKVELIIYSGLTSDTLDCGIIYAPTTESWGERTVGGAEVINTWTWATNTKIIFQFTGMVDSDSPLWLSRLKITYNRK